MTYPQRGASYKHEPKFLKELAGAESGVGRLQKAHNQAQPLRGGRAEGGGVDASPSDSDPAIRMKQLQDRKYYEGGHGEGKGKE